MFRQEVTGPVPLDPCPGHDEQGGQLGGCGQDPGKVKEVGRSHGDGEQEVEQGVFRRQNWQYVVADCLVIKEEEDWGMTKQRAHIAAIKMKPPPLSIPGVCQGGIGPREISSCLSSDL